MVRTKFGGIWVKMVNFLPICPLSAHLFLKSGHAESVAAQGFAGFLPTFPLFLYTIIKKKR